MQKDIQPITKTTKFKCASCGSVFDIESTYKQDVCHIDVCSKCHPWYLGKSSQNTVTGKSDKLNKKFTAGREFSEKKDSTTKKAAKKSNSKKVTSFKDIKVEE